MNIRLPQPPRPRPPDAPWTFGGIQRIALREACPGGPALRLVESEERA